MSRFWVPKDVSEERPENLERRSRNSFARMLMAVITPCPSNSTMTGHILGGQGKNGIVKEK